MPAVYPVKHLDISKVPVIPQLNGVDHVLVWSGNNPQLIALTNVMQSQSLKTMEAKEGNVELPSEKIHDAYLIQLESGTNSIRLPIFSEHLLNCSIKLTLVNPKEDQAFIVFDGGNANVMYEDPFDFALSNDGKDGSNRCTVYILSYIPLEKEPIWLVKRSWYRP